MAAKQPKRLTHADRQKRRKQIAEAVRKGSTLPQVIKRFGVSLYTVKIACREHGVRWNE